jgi:sugar phosphate isomerase/epimerase
VSTGIRAELGIFARVFSRPDPAALARAVAAAGFTTVQLNLSSVGLPTVPGRTAWDGIDLGPVGVAFMAAGVGIWGVSATVNLIHPDPVRRLAERRDVLALLDRVSPLGPQAVTLCSGTRDPENPWRRHPANDDPDAWRDIVDAMDELVPAAEHAGVTLGIEPEPGNVVADATAAARLLDELRAAPGTVGIVLDAANLVAGHGIRHHGEIVAEAVDLLGDEVICLHAKDIASGVAPGAGELDYEMIFDEWARLPRPVPVIVQDVTEEQAPGTSVALAAIADRHRWRAQ